MRPYIFIIFTLMPFLALHSSTARAAALADYTRAAEVIKVNSVVSATSETIITKSTIKGFAANDPYQVQTVKVPKANFLNHLKNLGSLVKKNAWYAAWFALMAAAGWAIDELTGQITKPNSDAQKGYYWWNGFSTPKDAGMHYCTVNKGYSGCSIKSIDFQSDTFVKVTYTYSPTPTTTSTSSVYFSRFQCEPDSTYSVCQPDYDNSEPITSDDLYNSIIGTILENPSTSGQAFMHPNGYPYPGLFPSSIPYIPGVSTEDQEMLDWYLKGWLQSTNPNAPYYASPDKFAEIKALADKLAAGSTPEADAEAENDKLKQPLTQAQLEETLKKEKDSEAKADQEAATNAKQALDPVEANIDALSEEKKWFEDAIKDSVNQAPPSSGLSLPKWTWPVGSCKPFPVVFTISGLTAKANDGGAFCDNYNDVYHPLIYWFLYMLLALYLFVLWNRTMVQVLGSR